MSIRNKIILSVILFVASGEGAYAQVPLIGKKRDSPDTVLIYNVYSTAMSMTPTGNKERPYDTFTARGPFIPATTGYDTISWFSEERDAANDCYIPAVSVYRNVLAPSFRNSYQYIKGHFNYPADAKAKGIHDFSVVEFRLDSNGKVGNAHIYKRVFPSIDAEAVRVVANMPDWQRGRRTANYIYRILLKY